ncbi:MAG: hypothetical protein JKY81_11785 [Colwellia sp.]|nr:hypothetical protein [Colwellia sp.]
MTLSYHSVLSKAIVSSLLIFVSGAHATNVAKHSVVENKLVSVPETATEKAIAAQLTEKPIEKNTSSAEVTQVESIPYPEECDDEDVIDFRLGNNSRDGFFLGVSAISSVGDDFSLPDANDNKATLDVDISYRLQLASLFLESPGLSSRRIHGMYSLPAWGINFYDNDEWSFDLFYQYSTRGIKGLEGIQLRNKDERAGLRISGYLENSQLQFIYSPVSRNGEGSDGIEASLSYGYNGQLRNWTYYADIGLQYRSKEVTPYHGYGYGELSENADDSAGLSYNAKAGLEYPLSKDWVFSGFVAYHALSDRNITYRQAYIEDDAENGYRAGLLLSFIF